MGRRKKRITVKGFTPTANPAMAAAMREKRSSSAASPHRVIWRKGSRESRRQQAVNDHKQQGA